MMNKSTYTIYKDKPGIWILTIESVNFLRNNLIVLVTHIFILAISARPSLSGSVQPVPLMATALLLLTDRGKQRIVCSAWSKPIPVSRQSTCRWHCHKSSGRLPLISTRPVVTFLLAERLLRLHCWGTSVNNLPKVIANLSVTTYYSTTLAWTLAVHASSTGFNHH